MKYETTCVNCGIRIADSLSVVCMSCEEAHRREIAIRGQRLRQYQQQLDDEKERARQKNQVARNARRAAGDQL